MYREKDLQDCIFGLVGWLQNDNPDYPQLPPALTQSLTGQYFQQENALVNIENIDQSFKNYDHYNYSSYMVGAAYLAGVRIRYAGDKKVYSANADIASAPDPFDPLQWTEVNLLAQKLELVTRAAINRFASTVFIEKKLNTVTKSIFENVQLFDGAGSMLNTEIPQGRFVGFEISLKEHRDVTIELRRLGTQFSVANPGFKIYIFHSSQEDPIEIINQNLTKANSFQWSAMKQTAKPLLDVCLRYNGPDYMPGGSYYIGYYEEDLVGQAINMSYDFKAIPKCQTCNNNYYYWSNWSKFFDLAPFIVDANDLIGIKPSDANVKLWNIQKNGYTYAKNYGLNLDISVKCDVTDFFCREKYLFADVLNKQVTVDVLEELSKSTRNNVISKEVQQLALYELNNKDGSNARIRLEKSIKAIGFDLSDLNESCLPCNEKWGPTWGAV